MEAHFEQSLDLARLNSLLGRGYTVKISPPHGIVGASVRVYAKLPPHEFVAEGRSIDLGKALHRAMVALEIEEGKK